MMSQQQISHEMNVQKCHLHIGKNNLVFIRSYLVDDFSEKN